VSDRQIQKIQNKQQTKVWYHFGAIHQIISEAQYSYLVATVIGSAVVSTMIANAFFMPTHLLRKEAQLKEPNPQLAASHN
jgi:H+/gluconate symporter-like permease